MKKVTEKQYLKAVEIIDRYNQQKKFENAKNKTELWGWLHDDNIINEMNLRLHSLLLNYSNKYYWVNGERYEKNNIPYVQDITYDELMGIRGFGKKAWEEFIKVRGY